MGCIRFSWRVRLQIGHHRGMKVLFALLVLCLSITAVRAQGACPPPGWSLERLQGLKSRKWQVEGDTERNDLARQLLPCLAARDPVLRDDLAFEALQVWMRGKALAGEQIKSLGASLLERMQAPDAEGIGQPFAALAMSEVARADRLQPLWSAAERQAVVEASAAWMKSRRDYRGFEPGIGWRHAVAHGADLLLQLTLNPQLDKAQLESILDAVASQVMPASGHSYLHGESERLARPVIFAARRQLHSEADWTAWFQRLAATAVPARDAPTSLDALARMHNLKAFLYPLYATVMEGSDAELRQRLRPGLVAALRALP